MCVILFYLAAAQGFNDPPFFTSLPTVRQSFKSLSLKKYVALVVGNFFLFFWLLRKTGRPEAVGRADRKIRFVCVSVIEGLTKICVPSEPSCCSQASGQPPKPPGINMSLLQRGVAYMSSVTSPCQDTEQIPRRSLLMGATNQSTEKSSPNNIISGFHPLTGVG